MFQDYLFYGADVEMRYAYRMAHLSNILQHAQQLHETNPHRTCALGETFLGCLLLSSSLIDEERLNLRVRHEGEFLFSAEAIVQTAELKGFVEVEEGRASVEALDKGALGDVNLQVRTLRSELKQGSNITEGITLSLTNSIEQALNEHIEKSYQVKGKVWLQSWMSPLDNKPRAFGAFFLELPNTPPEISTQLWEHVSKLPSPRELFEKSDDPDFLAQTLIPHKTRAVKSITPRWSCTCSQQAVEGMLVKLPDEELVDMINKGEALEIKCHYCSQKYKVDLERVAEIFVSKNEASQIKN